MIKGIFVLDKLNKKKTNKALSLGVNAVFVGYKNYDKDLIKTVKSKGVKIYLEIGLFAGEELWRQYPDARPVDRNRRPMEKIGWYAGVCPNHLEVRREKLQLIKLIVNSHDIDGIWLDFIRYPCHWEIPDADLTEYCFCSNCLEKFKQEIGGKPEGKKWTQWKCDQITNFVTDAYSSINQSGKDIKLGMFSVPWRETDFNGAIKKVIGQDLRRLAKDIDVFSPMVYHKMCGKSTNWIHEIVVYMDKITGNPILPIIQTEDKPAKISQQEFKREMVNAVKSPSQGVIIFFLEDLLKDRNKSKIVKGIFR